MESIALVTLTSDRPLAFHLCEQWMRRAISQFDGPLSWFVIDDGTVPVRCTLGQTHVRRPPSKSRTESFLGNLLTGLHCAQGQQILFVEDDDWYSQDYLDVYAHWLDECDIVGEAQAKYYSPLDRRFTLFDNHRHASLCQTGISSRTAAWLSEHILSAADPFVDLDLWTASPTDFVRRLEPQTVRCIGMKGLPGKAGFGDGHRGVCDLDTADPDGIVLSSWIGDDDARLYLEMVNDQKVTQPSA